MSDQNALHEALVAAAVAAAVGGASHADASSGASSSTVGTRAPPTRSRRAPPWWATASLTPATWSFAQSSRCVPTSCGRASRRSTRLRHAVLSRTCFFGSCAIRPETCASAVCRRLGVRRRPRDTEAAHELAVRARAHIHVTRNIRDATCDLRQALLQRRTESTSSASAAPTVVPPRARAASRRTAHRTAV